jgi:hypothetical protein
MSFHLLILLNNIKIKNSGSRDFPVFQNNITWWGGKVKILKNILHVITKLCNYMYLQHNSGENLDARQIFSQF